MINFDLSNTTGAKESDARLTPGIKDCTFQGVSFTNVTSQKTGDAYETMSLKLNIKDFGEYTQNFFEPKNNERQKMSWGLSASPLDHFLITVREIIEAVAPDVMKEIDEGKRKLGGKNFKEMVNNVKAITDPYVGTEVQAKFIPQNNGFSQMPTFVARITRNGDLGISTRIIGHDLVLTSTEQKRIETANSATPTNMSSTVKNSDLLGDMAESLGLNEDKDDLNDLPF